MAVQILSQSYGPRKPLISCTADSLNELADLVCAEGSTATVGGTEYVLDRVNGWIEPGSGGSGGSSGGGNVILTGVWHEYEDSSTTGYFGCKFLPTQEQVEQIENGADVAFIVPYYAPGRGGEFYKTIFHSVTTHYRSTGEELSRVQSYDDSNTGAWIDFDFMPEDEGGQAYFDVAIFIEA